MTVKTADQEGKKAKARRTVNQQGNTGSERERNQAKDELKKDEGTVSYLIGTH